MPEWIKVAFGYFQEESWYCPQAMTWLDPQTIGKVAETRIGG
jgi:hypothetical protein